jgi:UPF0716 protein FxsA
MLIRLFLLFTLLPLIELYLLIKVGSYLGAGLTILLVLGTGIAGAYLARLQGWRTWRRMQENLRKGVAPTGDVVDGILILAAGLLLVSPGVITDIIGLALLLPPMRAAFKAYLRRKLEAHARSTQIQIHIDQWP